MPATGPIGATESAALARMLAPGIPKHVQTHKAMMAIGRIC